jgi:D-glycero-D-manno-heptose 1,7-bisphosphate phosphatase
MGIGKVSGPLRRAVFLDRDGVLNRPVVRNGKPYPPASLDEFEILPDAAQAVSLLRGLGFYLCVVTNQPDVARGSQSVSNVEAMHARLRDRLQLTDFYVCYHDDADSCECRKPRPGLLLRAAAERELSLSESYMVGDRWRDVDCGHAAGCTTVFIERGYMEPLRKEPHFRAPDFHDAARVISRQEGFR